MILIIGGAVVRAQSVSQAQIQHDVLRDIVQAFENHAIAKGFFPQAYDLHSLTEEGFLSVDSYAHDHGVYLEEVDGTYLRVDDAAEEFPIHLFVCEDRVAVWTFSEEQSTAEEALAWWHEHECPQPEDLNYMHISAGDLLLLLPGDELEENLEGDSVTQETGDEVNVSMLDYDDWSTELVQGGEEEDFREKAL